LSLDLDSYIRLKSSFLSEEIYNYQFYPRHFLPRKSEKILVARKLVFPLFHFDEEDDFRLIGGAQRLSMATPQIPKINQLNVLSHFVEILQNSAGRNLGAAILHSRQSLI
jgi:hypothetical protein